MKYLGIALVSTMQRTSGSAPRPAKASATWWTRSGAMALTGRRFITTVATAPLRSTLTCCSDMPSEGEEVDAAGHMDHLAGDVARLLGAEEDHVVGAGEVDQDIAVPELVGLRLDLADVVEGGGVVDQDVERAELLDDAAEHLADLIAVGDVHLDRHRAAPHLADLLAGALRVDDV